MTFSMLERTSETSSPPGNQRAAPRYTSLIRAAKLITSAGEFVCVVRDVSQTGVKVKLFHGLPPSTGPMALELQNGEKFPLRLVRQGDQEASFAFLAPVIVERLIREHWTHPKRQFRIALSLPVSLFRANEASPGTIDNISQQGARITAAACFATNELLRIEAPHIGCIHAKVRWHRSDSYGVVFEDTFTLATLAHLAARVQCPGLLPPH